MSSLLEVYQAIDSDVHYSQYQIVINTLWSLYHLLNIVVLLYVTNATSNEVIINISYVFECCGLSCFVLLGTFDRILCARSDTTNAGWQHSFEGKNKKLL